MGVKPAEVGGKKIRRMDKKCPCGEQMRGCLYSPDGKHPKFHYHCTKCDKFYSKKEAETLESVYVVA